MPGDMSYVSSLSRDMVVKDSPIRSWALWNQFRCFERECPGLLPVTVALAVTSTVCTSATIAVTVTAIGPAVPASLMLLRPVLAHLLV